MILTATFIGHRDCFDISKDAIKQKIVELIEHGYSVFTNGAMGNFDLLCAKCVYELKQIYPQIKNIVVIPYLSFKIPFQEYFDEVVYPEGFEKYHFKSAIVKRNRYLVDNATASICYVKYSFGGAIETFKYAEKKGIAIINLAK